MSIEPLDSPADPVHGAIVTDRPAPRRRKERKPRAEDFIGKPDPKIECNWLICDGYADPDPRAHHKNCPGHKATGWRARLPEAFVHAEIERIKAGKAEDTPTFRALAIERAIEARYGEAIAS